MRSVRVPLRNWSVFLALFAVVCSIVLTTAAMSPLHGHRQQGNCDLCKASHLPSLQAVQQVTLAAPDLISTETVQQPSRPAESPGLISADSRAPPFES